jgi:intein-encoded DNA endonuclease-like protein
LDARLLLFEEVLRLRRECCSYSQIQDKIAKERMTTLSTGTISNWVRGITTPLRAGHMFVPEPSPELAYVIGAETGDASLNVKAKTYQYRIRLQAVDREFVEAFNQAVAKLLRCPPHRLWKGETAREIHVEFGSYLLYTFLRQPFEAFGPFVEHDDRCVAAFLRGFFDSEGSVDNTGKLTASNSNLKLLHYVQYLLAQRFGICTTGPHLGTRKGSMMTRGGKSFRREVDCYFIYVRTACLGPFREKVGLTIQRKARRLENR